ncbi:MAG: HAD family phosphatase, partial [Verrucomicrobia bacterium]
RQPFFPGVEDLLRRLHGRWRLAVASGSDRAVVEAVLQLRGLRRFFDVVLARDSVTRGKPAPDIFLEAARQLGVAPADCWVIEDSKPGIEAAQAAGMRVIAFAGTHPPEELAGATCVVRSHQAIGAILDP